MKDPSTYKYEFKQIEKDGILSLELIRDMRPFFEWNSLPLNLKNLDRDSSLFFVKDLFENSKVLSGNEGVQKRINLYVANRRFIDYLSQYKSDDFKLRRIRLLFSMYNCLAIIILKEKECISYIEHLIAEIQNEAVQSDIALEFKKLVRIIEMNDISRKGQRGETSKFLIEQKTIEYFKMTNF